MTAHEFRQLLCKEAAKRGYRETWSGGKGPLLQGYHYSGSMPDLKSHWSVWVTVRRGTVVADHKGTEKRFSLEQPEQAIKEILDWVLG